MVPRSQLARVLVLLAAPAALSAQDARDVSALLEPVRAANDLPGLVAVTTSSEALLAQGAAGVRRRGAEAPITVADRMHLGSCTKSMTATLAALCVAAGEVRWSTTLGETFPAVEMDPAWRGITLELLCTNRSGAPSGLDAGGLWETLWNHPGTPLEQRRTLLEGVTSRAPVAGPGERFVYSNGGFAMAGHVLETAAGKPWEQLMQERLFAPLGITTAGFGAPGTRATLDEPRGHRPGGDAIEPGPGSDNPAAIGPAGTVHMSLPDWARYVRLHLAAARGQPSLLDADAFAKLQTPYGGEKGGYAMGWRQLERDWAQGRVLVHNGSNTMWFCVTWIAPEIDFAVLVAANQGGEGAERGCDRAAWALIEDHLERARRAPAAPGGK